jgi:hypothetical protein
MYPSSGEFKTALLSNHTVVSKAEVWNQESKIYDLPISDGKVSISANSGVRRTCDITLFTTRKLDNLVPDTAFDTLAPFGNELKLFRGIEFSNGTIEYIPLGVFVMTDVKIQDINDGVQISIQGEDRSLIISRAKWTQPYQMVSGSLEDSLTNMLQNRWVDIETSFAPTNVTVNQIVFGTESSQDPWQDAVSLAQLVGYDLYFDVTGVAVLRPFPSLDGVIIDVRYVEGTNMTITSLDRNMSSKETYNGVIYTVEGSQVDPPIRVEVWDEDTTSPTYRYGVFGDAPTFITSNVISTAEEAIKAATALLDTYKGAQENISWRGIVDPTLDVNDIAYISTNGSKVDRVVIIDQLEIPLTPAGSMSANTRTVRVVDIGEETQVVE